MNLYFLHLTCTQALHVSMELGSAYAFAVAVYLYPEGAEGRYRDKRRRMQCALVIQTM